MTIPSISDTATWEEFASNLSRNATDTDKLMAAICYMFENEQVNSTDISIIADDYFRRARWSRPINLSATANYCAGRGWLSEAEKMEGRKRWRLTRKGYDSIRRRLN